MNQSVALARRLAPRRRFVSSFILHPSSFPRRQSRRRGSVMVIAIWGIIVLTAMVLILARSMKAELTVSSNRVGEVQAAAIVRGAEQYVLALVEGAAGDPSAVNDVVPDVNVVGEGYFFLVKPDPDDPTFPIYGITDEGSKLHLNSAGPDELLKLPGITQDVVDAIIDWRDSDSNVTNQGAEDEYYTRLAGQPYRAKNAPFESIDELKLVKGITPEILFGQDLNRDGVLDEYEESAEGTASMFNSATGAGRGIAPFLTVYATEPVSNAQGVANVNDEQNGNAVTQALATALGNPSRAQSIVQAARRQRPYASVFDFCAKGGMTAEEVKQSYKSLVARSGNARTVQGRVNINTAPREVLLCLPGLTESDVESLASRRTSAEPGDMSWVYEALGPQRAANVGAWITDKSYQYSADIVAMTGNGRSFKRVRIVVDGRQSPARIVHRKDVSELGLPYYLLDAQTTLRNGGTLNSFGGSLGF